MDETLKTTIGLLIRHGMTAWAGVMGWTWWTTGSLQDAFITLAVAVVAVGWSFLQKQQAATTLADAHTTTTTTTTKPTV